MTTMIALRAACCEIARVPMLARDSQAPMITDGTDDPLVLHRPGWRIASGGSERDVLLRDSQRKLIEDAQAEYLGRLTNAWKGGNPRQRSSLKSDAE
jgi:hypothetical protein